MMTAVTRLESPHRLEMTDLLRAVVDVAAFLEIRWIAIHLLVL